MNVTVEYAAQVKRAAGIAREEISLDQPCGLAELVTQLAERHGDPLKSILLDSSGRPQPSILVFIGDDQVRWDDQTVQVSDGQTVTLLSPVSGG